MKTLMYSLCWLCMFLASVVHAVDDWTPKSPAAKPSVRYLHAMAYIGGDQVLLFGGDDGSSKGDTWVYDLSDNTWTQKFPVSSPSARSYHAMTYLGGDQVLLFGGQGPLNNETWVYDFSDNNWTQKLPASSPSPRRGHSMVYLGGDQVLLFDGDVPGINDTWVYDLSDNNWTQKSPASSPVRRFEHGMAYLGGDQAGGFTVEPYSETWVYDLSTNTWTQNSPASSPSARQLHVMAYLGGDQALLFGGGTGSGTFNGDTWVYDLSDNAWTQKSPSSNPSARYGHRMADIGSNKALLFGGYDGSFKDDTWVYTSTPQVVEMDIDIKPGSSTNPINPNSNDVIPVAILTTASFDATTVDPLSVKFGPNVATESHGKGHIQDADGDGDNDLVLHFKTQQTGIQCGDTQASLIGKTFDGQDITGTDAIQTVGCGSSKAAAEAEAGLPEGYALLQNYPNPFNPETEIRFQLPEAGHVVMKIFTINGKETRTLIDAPYQAGYHLMRWDGKDKNGNSVASGVYLYQLRAGNFSQVKKMSLLR